MQLDFHYYATYCAACIAGYTPEESLQIAYSAQFVDCCSVTLLRKTGGPLSAATTQLQLEMMNEGSDISSIQNMTRIWASFHFLPGDLHAEKEKCNVSEHRHQNFPSMRSMTQLTGVALTLVHSHSASPCRWRITSRMIGNCT